MPDVLLDRPSEGVALVTLNRPDSANAMGGSLLEELAEHLEACERDREVRCVALTGAGKAFCAGGDMKAAAGRGGSGEERPSFPRMLEDGVRRLRRSVDGTAVRLHTMAKPTVALVNGAAAGAGMSLALACDLRIFSDRGRLVPAFGKVALSGDFGGSFFLTKLAGSGRARACYLLGEQVDAQTALEWGVANQVVAHDSLLDEGLALCARIAAGPPAVLARMKANLNLAEHATLTEHLDLESMHHQLSSLGKDFREGATAFVEKRDPRFTGE
jgi:2-(1,2-epoxy-1,2-dihydrophenyl)acetyl-CoA isomerase